MLRLGLKAVCAWAVCVMTAGCVSTVGGTAVPAGGHGPGTTQAKPAVTAADLPKLLATVDEIKDVMKSPNIVTQQTWNKPDDSTDTKVDPVECTSAAFGGEASAYYGSGFTAIYIVRQADPQGIPDVDEGVATFDDAAAAKNFVSKWAAQWRQCAGKQLVWTWPDGSTVPWALGDPAESGGVATIRNTAVRQQSLGLERVLAAKSNVVVDLQVLGMNLSDEATLIAKRILERIPG
ncbi:sensor domain-containing protein [Mycobacterium celatum]|uniref:Sensor domain-containing protein n=1 Tax=Mycobacterium celatum TaxID=28045 RepID=A0A1X1RMK2_MYCCE|nr:sensor domain-containing protein [Mycobacterium celatum]ORV09855.1 hypothetical protein AWB95_16635 [Mycobacterium celatum]PIB79664.1 sensor domain-containing protein [Mycobacterium celatum]